MSSNDPGSGARRPSMWLALLSLAACLVASPASAARYTLIDLATLDEGATVVVRGVNAGGTAVGAGRVAGARRGLLFTPEGVQAVDGLEGSDYSVVFDINDLGAVVGGANGPAATPGDGQQVGLDAQDYQLARAIDLLRGIALYETRASGIARQ